MPLPSFSNPQALWLLTALLPLTLVYVFQIRRKRMETSTLFLFRHLPQDTRSGSRLERFISSKAYWWQVLCIVLATLCWANPLLDSQRQSLHIALIIDSSPSMQLSAEQLGNNISRSLQQIYPDKYRLEYHIFSDALEQPQIVSGNSLEQLPQKIAGFLQHQQMHRRNNQIFGIVQNRIGPKGDIFYVSDHFDSQIPSDINQLNYGQPAANLGLCNPRMQPAGDCNNWQANLINYSQKPATASWQLFDAAGQQALGEPQSVTLEPNAVMSLGGKLPSEIQRLQLRLHSQDLTLDNTLYLQCEQPRRLDIHAANGSTCSKLAQVLLQTLQAASLQQDPDLAELHIESYLPGSQSAAPASERKQKFFSIAAAGETDNPELLQGNIETGNSALVEDLYWDGLIVPAESCALPDDSYNCILSQNTRPLLSYSAKHARLLVHFDLARSNFLRLQAGIITLYRFAGLARQHGRGQSAGNFDCNQNLGLPSNMSGSATLQGTAGRDAKPTQPSLSSAKHLFALCAPSTPGFFELQLNDTAYLNGSANFNDSSEADTEKLDNRQYLDAVRAQVLQGAENFNWRIWLLALLGALLCLARELHKSAAPRSAAGSKSEAGGNLPAPEGF